MKLFGNRRRAAHAAPRQKLPRGTRAAIIAVCVVLALTGDWWLSAGLAAAGAVATAAMAGLASYLSILASGIPAANYIGSDGLDARSDIAGLNLAQCSGDLVGVLGYV